MRQLRQTWRDRRSRPTQDTSPAYLLVVAPTAREIGGLRSDRLAGFAVADVGMGPEAAENLRGVLEARSPQAMLLVGFGGALVTGLKTGDIVISSLATAVQMPNRHAQMSADHADLAFEALSRAGFRVSRGDALTVPTPLLSKVDKARHGALTGAMVVDMETFWIAQEAERSGVPMVSMRTVLDELEHDLPDLVADITADGGRREAYHAIKAMRNPANVGAMLPLALRARRAASATKDAVHALIPVLTRDAPIGVRR